MPDFTYTKAMAKAINYGSDDIRALIVMTTSTAPTDEDAEFITDFGTFAEYNGSGYARVTLAGKLWTSDTTNDRAKFTSDALVFTSIGAGSGQGFGIVFYKHVGADSANIPLFFKQPSGFPFTGNGQDVTVNPHADGWAYLRNGTL